MAKQRKIDEKAIDSLGKIIDGCEDLYRSFGKKRTEVTMNRGGKSKRQPLDKLETQLFDLTLRIAANSISGLVTMGDLMREAGLDPADLQEESGLIELARSKQREFPGHSREEISGYFGKLAKAEMYFNLENQKSSALESALLFLQHNALRYKGDLMKNFHPEDCDEQLEDELTEAGVAYGLIRNIALKSHASLTRFAFWYERLNMLDDYGTSERGVDLSQFSVEEFQQLVADIKEYEQGERENININPRTDNRNRVLRTVNKTRVSAMDSRIKRELVKQVKAAYKTSPVEGLALGTGNLIAWIFDQFDSKSPNRLYVTENILGETYLSGHLKRLFKRGTGGGFRLFGRRRAGTEGIGDTFGGEESSTGSEPDETGEPEGADEGAAPGAGGLRDRIGLMAQRLRAGADDMQTTTISRDDPHTLDGEFGERWSAMIEQEEDIPAIEYIRLVESLSRTYGVNSWGNIPSRLEQALALVPDTEDPRHIRTQHLLEALHSYMTEHPAGPAARPTPRPSQVLATGPQAATRDAPVTDADFPGYFEKIVDAQIFGAGHEGFIPHRGAYLKVASLIGEYGDAALEVLNEMTETEPDKVRKEYLGVLRATIEEVLEQ